MGLEPSHKEYAKVADICPLVIAEYHFKQQLLIQVARHVNCNKKQQLKKLEGKVRGLVVHRTQQTGRRIIAGRPRARSARIYFNRKEDTGPQTPCSCRASLQKSSQSCFLLRSRASRRLTQNALREGKMSLSIHLNGEEDTTEVKEEIRWWGDRLKEAFGQLEVGEVNEKGTEHR